MWMQICQESQTPCPTEIFSQEQGQTEEEVIHLDHGGDPHKAPGHNHTNEDFLARIAGTAPRY